VGHERLNGQHSAAVAACHGNIKHVFRSVIYVVQKLAVVSEGTGTEKHQGAGRCLERITQTAPLWRCWAVTVLVVVLVGANPVEHSTLLARSPTPMYWGNVNINP
jgi:hypothetical protein